MPTPSVIQLSHWQGDAVDFKAVAESGILGVIHTITEGAQVYDAAYDKNRANATAAGLAWGACHVLRLGDMQDQAEFFLQYAKPDLGTVLAVTHDDEAVSPNDLKVFLAAVRRHGHVDAVIHSGPLIRKQLGEVRDLILARHRLWAVYETTENRPIWQIATWPAYWLWEYTDHGQVPGVTSDVPLSAFGSFSGQSRVWAGERSATAA